MLVCTPPSWKWPTGSLSPWRSAARGVTLIELMVVLVVVAILASIAVPGYSRYLIRSHRSEAQQLMTTIGNRETQYLLDARAYTDTIGVGGLNLTSLDHWTCEASCINERYTISVTLDAEGFQVRGVPRGKQAGDGVLVLTSSGQRSRAVSGVEHGW